MKNMASHIVKLITILLLFSTNLVFSETMLEHQVGASADDASENYAAPQVANLTYTTIGLRASASYQEYMGVRFQTIPIPQNSTILSATLQFSYFNETYDARVDIWCEDIDDAPVFAASSGNISSRSKTTAKVDWDEDNITQWQDSPDLSACIQEVVNRGGWVENNDIVFIIQAKSSSHLLYPYTWDRSGNVSGAKFNCTYTPPTAGDTIKGYNHGGYGVKKN